MPDSLYFYMMIVVIIFAAGDMIGQFTRGKLSGLMVVMLLFLFGFVSGILPKDIINQAGLSHLAAISTAMVLFNMGASIDIMQLINEWKTVLMATLCMIASCITMFLAAPILGIETVLIGMPVINGAAMATSLMTQVALDRGLTHAAALCAVIYSVQKFVGTPIASAMGLQYARKIIVEFRKDPQKYMADLTQRQNKDKTHRTLFWKRHEKYFTSNVLLAIICIGGWLAHFLSHHTPIGYSIWALLFGILAHTLGIIPSKPLQRSNSYGLVMIAVLSSIIPSLASVSLSSLGEMAFQTILLFASACLGIFLVGWVLPFWKLVGDRSLAVGIGVEQFLGFPSNVVICHEVSEAIGETEDERTYIEETLSIPYLVGGITVVTILSTTLAGIIIGLPFFS